MSRRPHAIHKLRARMAKLSRRADLCVARAAEAERLLGESIAGGGVYHQEAEAHSIIEALIADLRVIAVECAVAELEPGHTRRAPGASDTQPVLLERQRTPARTRAASR
jgi:hypothetical protein